MHESSVFISKSRGRVPFSNYISAMNSINSLLSLINCCAYLISSLSSQKPTYASSNPTVCPYEFWSRNGLTIRSYNRIILASGESLFNKAQEMT